MQHGDGVAEAFDEAPDDLRRQRDLRHQHDRAAALLERGGGRAQVDLGLARPGDAVQQPLLGPARAQRGDQRRHHGLLVRSELGRARTGGAHAEMARAGDRATPASAQPPRGPGGQHESERAGDRRAVLGGDPFGQHDEVHGHAQLQRAQRGEQFLLGDLARVREAHDHAQHLAAAEGHDEHRADVHAVAQLLRQPVVERPAQGAGRRHRLDLGDGGHRWTLERAADHAPVPGGFSETGGRAQRCRLVGPLPGEVGVVAAEMPVGGCLLVDRPVQLELLAE